LIPLNDKIKKWIFRISLIVFIIPFICLFPHTIERFSTDDYKSEGNPIYELAIYFTLVYILVTMFLSLLFFIFLNVRINSFKEDSLFFTVKKRPIHILLGMVAICFVGFGIQEFFLFYRPITGKFLDQVLFVVMTYIVPEFLICVCLGIAMRNTRAKESEEDNNDNANMMIDFTA